MNESRKDKKNTNNKNKNDKKEKEEASTKKHISMDTQGRNEEM